MNKSLVFAGSTLVGLVLAVSNVNANPINKFNFGESQENTVNATANASGGQGGDANGNGGTNNANTNATGSTDGVWTADGGNGPGRRRQRQ